MNGKPEKENVPFGEDSENVPAMKKETETKEDGRYIVFYSFGEDGPNDKSGRRE